MIVRLCIEGEWAEYEAEEVAVQTLGPVEVAADPYLLRLIDTKAKP